MTGAKTDLVCYQGPLFTRNVKTPNSPEVAKTDCRREMSFAMGRPDTLGSDLYHNRRLPVTYESIESGTVPYQPELLEPPHCAIIRYMVDFSRITRALCLGIYLSDLSLPELLARANQLEQDLNRWVDSVPEAIRPSRIFSRKTSLKSVKDAQYAKRQRLVMTIRESN